MSFKIRSAAFILAASVVSAFCADSVLLERVTILKTELPLGSTWEVQQGNGSLWTNLGVLVAGSGALDTVRLDGFPSTEQYRMVNVSSGETTPPITDHGLGLSVTAPGATEIRLLAATNLSTPDWTHAAYLFPDAAGALRSVIPPSPLPQQYFRTMRPAFPLMSASVSYYPEDTAATYAGFGIVEDDMPAIYRQGYVCAPCPEFYHAGGLAAAAGECYELRGPFGAVTAMVADVVMNAPALCNNSGTYFDLGTPAFAALFPPSTGLGTVTRRLVPAPVTGGVKLVVVINSGGYYIELRPYNYRAGITNLEVRANGAASFVSLPRSDYNSFIWSGSPPAMPLTVRLTSRFGETITFPPIVSMQAADRFEADAQFSFPDVGPASVWRIPAVFIDQFSSVLGGRWVASSYGGATIDPAFTADRYQGSASLRIGSLAGWSGVMITHQQEFPPGPESFLEFAIKSGSGSAVTNIVVEISGKNSTGNPQTSASVMLPKIEGPWRAMRIPLSPARAPVIINRIAFRSMTPEAQDSLLLDSIQFRTHSPQAGKEAAP